MKRGSQRRRWPGCQPGNPRSQSPMGLWPQRRAANWNSVGGGLALPQVGNHRVDTVSSSSSPGVGRASFNAPSWLVLLRDQWPSGMQVLTAGPVNGRPLSIRFWPIGKRQMAAIGCCTASNSPCGRFHAFPLELQRDHLAGVVSRRRRPLEPQQLPSLAAPQRPGRLRTPGSAVHGSRCASRSPSKSNRQAAGRSMPPFLQFPVPGIRL